MRIETVHYERKRSDGQYGNRTVSLSATVDGDEPLFDCIAALRDLANQALDADEQVEVEAAERTRTEERERYRAEQAARQARWERDRVASSSARHEHDMTADLDDLDDGEDDLDDEDDEDEDEEPEV